ncbi:MAG: DUF72 domain-containing protein [Actinobacteria bacterium]|nr:DUF72 domain-containing protein [Actinomycetota bacterium]MSW76372.1 DUF72 domain-containing protein [Actinomycetota bacterium]MSX55496.1 DUF72 domain-containing protein [Actinomycetota bacterium]MSX94617.1 DUF72 domain-containing protein [Actinomycetota bacterium]MSZ82260.1 DUF72 domain-containing protein [Actinomycetota bacterium]
MPTLQVGCPMWAHRPWVGRHLPAGTRVGRELAAYSSVFNAVEGNTTFYASPTPSTIAKWAEQAQPGFRFVFKVPKRITHDQRLRDVHGELDVFCSLLEPLGELVGGLTLQLPPSFGPSDLDALDRVLGRASDAHRWSVEPRHPEFFRGGGRRMFDELLARHGAERVLLDTEPLFAQPPITDAGREECQQKPQLATITEPLTGHPIVRCIGNDDPEVTEAGLQRWEPVVARWLRDGRTPTFFVHTPTNLDTPALAQAFHAAVAMRVPGLAPLPRPLPVEQWPDRLF